MDAEGESAATETQADPPARADDEPAAQGAEIASESNQSPQQSSVDAATPAADSPAEQTRVEADGPFDPDAADLTQLVYWGPLDGFFGLRLRIPDSRQLLIERLLGSDSPAVDQYVIDLAAFPNPYRGQVMEYLRERYGTGELLTIFDYPEIFEFDPADANTPTYLRFKQALIGGQFPSMAEMMDPSAALTIDAREVMWGGVRVDGIPRSNRQPT